VTDQQLLALLTGILARREPSLLAAFVGEDATLTSDQREEIRLVVADELLQFGLDDDQDHTSYGRLLEDLIDLLGRL
jgi:hypothetical protein